MKKNLISIVLIPIVLAALLWVFCVDYYPWHKGMPPGWELVTDGQGRYAPKHVASGHVIDHYYRSSYGMGRQAAINRAWDQYEYEQSKAKRDAAWRPADLSWDITNNVPPK